MVAAVCQSPCATCLASSPTNCTSCVTTSATPFLVPATGTCVAAAGCPTGTYTDSTNHVCQQCDASCSACSGAGPTACTACSAASGLSLYKGSCIATCPGGFFSYYNSHYFDNLCEPCDALCASCISPATTDCLSCHPGAFFHQLSFFGAQLGECYAACPVSTVPSISPQGTPLCIAPPAIITTTLYADVSAAKPLLQNSQSLAIDVVEVSDATQAVLTVLASASFVQCSTNTSFLRADLTFSPSSFTLAPNTSIDIVLASMPSGNLWPSPTCANGSPYLLPFDFTGYPFNRLVVPPTSSSNISSCTPGTTQAPVLVPNTVEMEDFQCFSPCQSFSNSSWHWSFPLSTPSPVAVRGTCDQGYGGIVYSTCWADSGWSPVVGECSPCPASCSLCQANMECTTCAVGFVMSTTVAGQCDAIVPPTPTPTGTTMPFSANVGAIVGGAIGGVVGLLLLCFLYDYFFNKRYASPKTAKEIGGVSMGDLEAPLTGAKTEFRTATGPGDI